MQLNKKYFLLAGLPIAAAVAVGASQVQAHGFNFFGQGVSQEQRTQMQSQMFQEKADMLGISVDEFKNLWAQGKNFKEIAQEKGITQDQLKQKMQDQKKQQIQQHLQQMVTDGIITQEQANQRLQYMEQNMQSGKGMKKGFGRGHGFGQ